MKRNEQRTSTPFKVITAKGDGWVVYNYKTLRIFNNIITVPKQWQDLNFTTAIIEANIPAKSFENCKYLTQVFYKDTDEDYYDYTKMIKSTFVEGEEFQEIDELSSPIGILGNAGSINGITVIIDKKVTKLPEFLFQKSQNLKKVIFYGNTQEKETFQKINKKTGLENVIWIIEGGHKDEM